MILADKCQYIPSPSAPGGCRRAFDAKIMSWICLHFVMDLFTLSLWYLQMDRACVAPILSALSTSLASLMPLYFSPVPLSGAGRTLSCGPVAYAWRACARKYRPAPYTLLSIPRIVRVISGAAAVITVYWISLRHALTCRNLISEDHNTCSRKRGRGDERQDCGDGNHGPKPSYHPPSGHGILHRRVQLSVEQFGL